MIARLRWLFAMAWRDSRRSRNRLLVFSSPLIFGVAVLVAIQSLRDNVDDAIEEQSRALLGADLLLSSRKPFDDATNALLARIGGKQFREISFTTMALSPKTDSARLVQLRGVAPEFPYYGEILTNPPKVWRPDMGLRNGSLVMEESLLEQFGVQPGDTLKLGDQVQRIAGNLVNAPPRASMFAAFAPQVLIPIGDIADTNLLTVRSLAFYRVYIKLPNAIDPHQLAKSLEGEFKALRLSWQTPEKRREGISKQLGNLYRFLGIIGLASVILGGIGISSAIHQHISQRLASVAVLRCLGTPSGDAFAIYVIQAAALGVIGCLGGAFMGVALQASIPPLISAVAPLTITFRLSLPAIAMALTLSMIICLSFAILPLLKVRRIPPLAAIRSALLSQATQRQRDPLAIAIFAVLILALVGFSLLHAGPKLQSLVMVGGLIGVFLLLSGVARVAIMLGIALPRPWWPFAIRQGVANLHRPSNQTFTIILSLGLGVFLILTLLLAQRLLLDQLDSERFAEKGNLFLIDVQPDQRQGVEDILEELQCQVIQTAPMVSMRLMKLKGRDVIELAKDPKVDIPGWTLRRDFRCTYREALDDSEKLVEGSWVGRVDNWDVNQPAPVSIEKGIAEDLKITVGDQVIMDVQGLELTLQIASIREVDWGTMGLNFFFVFPEGILEEALGFQVYTTFVEDPKLSGSLQTRLAKNYANITVIDLTLVVEALEDILEKVALAIRFMAAFTIFTGFLILFASLISGRSERLKQMALLRTLGASNRQIWRILCSEYAALGILASVAGAVLATLALWPLATRVFDTDFDVNPLIILVTILISGGATLGLGLVLSRSVTRYSPIQVLRQE